MHFVKVEIWSLFHQLSIYIFNTYSQNCYPYDLQIPIGIVYLRDIVTLIYTTEAIFLWKQYEYVKTNFMKVGIIYNY